jgi:hypothetical protein
MQYAVCVVSVYICVYLCIMCIIVSNCVYYCDMTYDTYLSASRAMRACVMCHYNRRR